MNEIGKRLKRLRSERGMSLRELARLSDVSPSFLSQIENGKSQPSVATLFTFAKQLEVPIDTLFEADSADSLDKKSVNNVQSHSELNAQSAYSNPADVWQSSAYANRISVIHSSHRAKLNVSEGVHWERLAATPERSVNFMKITYSPGASSTDSGELLTHSGYEYGYVLEGEFEVTVGGEVFVIKTGESLGFDSTIPHIFRNPGDIPAVGIWTIHGSCFSH
jgi:transcriptional regulator with XRE-family HTH domain